MRLTALIATLTMGCATPYLTAQTPKGGISELVDPFEAFLNIDHPSMEHRVRIGERTVYTRDGGVINVIYEGVTNVPHIFFALAVGSQEHTSDPAGKAIYNCYGTVRNVNPVGALIKGSCDLVGHSSEARDELVRRYLENIEPPYGLPLFHEERNARRDEISRLVVEGLKGLLREKNRQPQPERQKTPWPAPRPGEKTVLARF